MPETLQSTAIDVYDCSHCMKMGPGRRSQEQESLPQLIVQRARSQQREKKETAGTPIVQFEHERCKSRVKNEMAFLHKISEIGWCFDVL